MIGRIIFGTMILASSFSCAEPELELRVFPSEDYAAVSGQVYVVLVSSAMTSENYWRLLLFESRESGGIEPLSSLASLSEIAEQQFKDSEEKLSPGEFGKLMSQILWPVVESNMIVIGGQEHCDEVLAMLRDEISDESFAKVKRVLGPSGFSCSGNEWDISYVLVTDQGAIEKRVFRGTVSPAQIGSLETIVLAGNRTVPDFGYSFGQEGQ